jgi:hypothetical protein
MYIELKSSGGGHTDNGPAWSGRVELSKTGRTIYYRGRRLQRANCICGNFIDLDNGDEFWVSGPKKNGQDRYPWARTPIQIDQDVREEYWTRIRNHPGRIKEVTT